MVCKNCGRFASRARGLCWICYYSPARELFPRGCNTGLVDFFGAGQVCQPTDAEPGSEEKILVLMARAEAKQRLWHEGDRTLVPRGTGRGRATDERVCRLLLNWSPNIRAMMTDLKRVRV